MISVNVFRSRPAPEVVNVLDLTGYESKNNILVDEAIADSAASVKLVKDLDTKLYPYTNNQVYREIFEHFYDSREVSLLNLISQVSGVVINKINPN